MIRDLSYYLLFYFLISLTKVRGIPLSNRLLFMIYLNGPIHREKVQGGGR